MSEEQKKIGGFSGMLIRLLVKDHQNAADPRVRGRYGAAAGIVGIVANTLLCAGKMLIGFISGSVSITADAVNNLSDAASSLMTLIGFRISQKPPDKEHPYGHARVEYLSGLAVAALILIIGFQLAKSSVEKILAPSPVEFSPALVAVLVLAILVKLWLAAFNKKVGRHINSSTLLAAAADSRNDVISTAAVLAAALISRFFGIDLDGWMGLAVALFILYSGIGIGKETIAPLLGAPPDPELVKSIGEKVLNFDDRILGFHDLVVHDYGPGQCFATIHAEMDYRLDPLEAHELLDDIESSFRSEDNIQLVIHYDPLVVDDPRLNSLKSSAADHLKEIDPRLMLHDFRMVRGEQHTNLIFDVPLPHDLHGREDEIREDLQELIRRENSDMIYYLVINYDRVF